MREIGGYLELERFGGEEYHSDAFGVQHCDQCPFMAGSAARNPADLDAGLSLRQRNRSLREGGKL